MPRPPRRPQPPATARTARRSGPRRSSASPRPAPPTAEPPTTNPKNRGPAEAMRPGSASRASARTTARASRPVRGNGPPSAARSAARSTAGPTTRSGRVSRKSAARSAVACSRSSRSAMAGQDTPGGGAGWNVSRPTHGARYSGLLTRPMRRDREEAALAERYDAVVIGGGHNGLVSAAYLARAGTEDARPRATPRPRRRRRHRGALPGLPLLRRSRYVVSLLRPEIIRDLELPRHGLRHPAARRHVHAARRRLPVADQRPRPDDPRAAPLVGDRRRGVRGVRPADGRDGALHQAHPGHHAARPDAASTRGRCCPWPACCGPSRQLPRRQQTVVRAAHDDERGGLPRPVVRDRSAQGHDVRVRDHRHVPGRARPGTAYVLLHHYMGEIDGAFRAWGIPKGGTGGVSEAIGSAARALGRGDPDRGAGRAHHRHATGARPGVVLESRARRSRPDAVLELARRQGRRSSTCSSRARSSPTSRSRGPPVPVPRLVGQGQPGRSTGCPTSPACPGSGEHLRGAISFSPVARLHGAGLRRRQGRPLQPPSRTST